MDAMKIAGIITLVAGVLGLIYGGFNYTPETHELSAGAVKMSVAEQGGFNIPSWLGVVIMAIGGGVLLITGKK